jgi:hypothetical protein
MQARKLEIRNQSTNTTSGGDKEKTSTSLLGGMQLARRSLGGMQFARSRPLTTTNPLTPRKKLGLSDATNSAGFKRAITLPASTSLNLSNKRKTFLRR